MRNTVPEREGRSGRHVDGNPPSDPLYTRWTSEPPTAVRSRMFAFFCQLGDPRMANAFDPYREALVVENHTNWPAEYEDWSAAAKARIEALLHANPQEAAELDYLRQHTGFARVITVTPADLDRVSVS